jgi:diguanylate cyclase (GGDEF)-like protein
VGRDADDALDLAERIRSAISELPGPFTHSGYHPQISGGVSALGHNDTSFSSLVQRAERALELAKTNGRNQIVSLLAP